MAQSQEAYGILVDGTAVCTGYAGLLRLSTLRPDIVKLDRGLVTGARHNDVQAVVVEALVSLARRIGARTLGEKGDLSSHVHHRSCRRRSRL